MEHEAIKNFAKPKLTKTEQAFNSARQKAFQSLCITLDTLYGKCNISEIDFKNEWYNNLKKQNDIIADGWYNPPPKGMAVLFGNRVSFDSLRNEKNWANNTTINWNKDLLYAYCSPIDKISGIIGDISLTLYFGKDEKIINHIKNCHNAVQEIFNNLNKFQNYQELFIGSEEIFAKHKLKNCIISKTDDTPLDLGHTFPKLDNLQNKNSLTEEDKQKISKARMFINENSIWNFTEELQFTIEPQLISTENPELPQISQHYLVKKYKNEFIICQDIDYLLRKFTIHS